jgi:hypothetical protein
MNELFKSVDRSMWLQRRMYHYFSCREGSTWTT